MENIGIFLNSQPFIALFLVIGLGYAVGQIKIGGLSLGIGAVLFVGLGVGAIAPKAAPPGLLGTVGLVLFLYGIGIQYGRDFFKGLMSPLGIKANLLAAFAVLMGCAVAIAMARFFGFGSDFVAGMFAGSLTSTATLQAAMEASGSKEPGRRLCDRLSVRCLWSDFMFLSGQVAVPAEDRSAAPQPSCRCRGPGGRPGA